MGLGLRLWHYLSSARMPTERDASAVTASTSASAPGILGSQVSGQEAKRCMQPQYFPRTRPWVSWGKTSCLSYTLDQYQGWGLCPEPKNTVQLSFLLSPLSQTPPYSPLPSSPG